MKKFKFLKVFYFSKCFPTANESAFKNLCGIKLLMNVCLAQEVRRE